MSTKFEPLLAGPSGGTGGTAFHPEKPDDAVKIIRVFGKAANRVDRIGFDWISANDELEPAGPFGGSGGDDFEFLIPAGDYLTQIHGSVGQHNNSERVFTIRFVTKNNKISPTFGGGSNHVGTPYGFSFQCPDGYQIINLRGRAGEDSGGELDAIGINMQVIEA